MFVCAKILNFVSLLKHWIIYFPIFFLIFIVAGWFLIAEHQIQKILHITKYRAHQIFTEWIFFQKNKFGFEAIVGSGQGLLLALLRDYSCLECLQGPYGVQRIEPRSNICITLPLVLSFWPHGSNSSLRALGKSFQKSTKMEHFDLVEHVI